MKRLYVLAFAFAISAAAFGQSAQTDAEGDKPVFKEKQTAISEAAKNNPALKQAPAKPQTSQRTAVELEAQQTTETTAEIREEMRKNAQNPNYDGAAAQRRLKAAYVREQK